MTTNAAPLEGKVAILTGAATIFGIAVAKELVDQGAQIYLVDINSAGLEEALNQCGAAASGLCMDITSDTGISEIVSQTAATWGGIDLLINLACSYEDSGADSTREEWMNTFNVNVASAAMLAQAVRPHMIQRGGGSIVNLSSISSKVAQIGRWTYPVSKAAMVQLTRNMAMDFAPDHIRVNSVSPGWTWSAIMDSLSGGNREKTDAVAAPFHLTQRVGDPREVARVIAFLCSEASSVVTGADWAADGGYSAMGPEQGVPAIPLLME
jgi:NAD(P)-dependent dehydrogenase (short-subunit alcohol dehydrogenase family)